ncbi:MAG: hypothetical protein ACRDQW_09815 [Haloechinothrix sp.]
MTRAPVVPAQRMAGADRAGNLSHVLDVATPWTWTRTAPAGADYHVRDLEQRLFDISVTPDGAVIVHPADVDGAGVIWLDPPAADPNVVASVVTAYARGRGWL